MEDFTVCSIFPLINSPFLIVFFEFIQVELVINLRNSKVFVPETRKESLQLSEGLHWRV